MDYSLPEGLPWRTVVSPECEESNSLLCSIRPDKKVEHRHWGRISAGGANERERKS